MRNILTLTLLLFVFGLSAQGDGTAPYTIKQLPNGKIQVSIIPTANYNVFSATNFMINVPSNTTISNPTFFYNISAVPGGTNEYGHVIFQTVNWVSGIEYPLMTFSWTTTNPSGTTGTFSIQNDFTNYVELDLNDRSGPPINTANNIPLPIKLTDFTADRFADERAADLKWTSSSEIQASHYDIERSIDGSNFDYVATVNAKGNTNWQVKYNYLDNNLPSSRSLQSIYYYRLKMVDLDGRFEYSEIRSVRFDESDVIDITYYPNPTVNRVFVNLSTPFDDEPGDVNAVIFDLNGKQIMTRSISTNGITEIDLSHLPAASYNFNVEFAGKVFTKTIIKTN